MEKIIKTRVIFVFDTDGDWKSYYSNTKAGFENNELSPVTSIDELDGSTVKIQYTLYTSEKINKKEFLNLCADSFNETFRLKTHKSLLLDNINADMPSSHFEIKTVGNHEAGNYSLKVIVREEIEYLKL